MANRLLDNGMEILRQEDTNQVNGVNEMLTASCEEGRQLLEQFSDEDLHNPNMVQTHSRLAVIIGVCLCMVFTLISSI